MMDDYNQREFNLNPNRLTLFYPDDDVTGYTPELLFFLVLQMRGNLDAHNSFINTPRVATRDVKSILKSVKPAGVTDAQLNQLMERYNQFWVGQWMNGLIM